MRKAFIGMSTPIGFDYRNQASKAPADKSSSPNPVLDAPFGLMLLFDELVFFTRSLCPDNMRDLPYVSFLDEQGKIPDVTEEEINVIWKAAWDAPYKQASKSISFQDSLENAGVTHGMGIDNHSHDLSVGPIKGQANASLPNLVIDTYIIAKLNDPSIELISNSRLQPYIECQKNVSGQSRLTELLVLDNIPNYLTPQGPYHPVIDEVRNNIHISEFRKWVVKQQGLASPAEVKEVKDEVENVLRLAQEDIFLKHLDPTRHFRSVGKAMLGDAIGTIFPLAGAISALIETGVDVVSPQAQRWQGFVVGARHAAHSALT